MNPVSILRDHVDGKLTAGQTDSETESANQKRLAIWDSWGKSPVTYEFMNALRSRRNEICVKLRMHTNYAEADIRTLLTEDAVLQRILMMSDNGGKY
jgi:hypothetical protein